MNKLQINDKVSVSAYDNKTLLPLPIEYGVVKGLQAHHIQVAYDNGNVAWVERKYVYSRSDEWTAEDERAERRREYHDMLDADFRRLGLV